MYELLPEELRAVPKWICWRGEYDPKHPEKPRKVPINPHNGGRASTTDPSTWTTFTHAVQMSGNYSGIGFVFDGTGYFGIDIDNRKKELDAFLSGQEDTVIGEFVHTMKSYTERSQSGTGIHILCKGKLPEGRRKNGDFEMYDSGRFFVCTGDICAEYADLSDGTEAVRPLHEKYLQTETTAYLPKSETEQLPLPAHLSPDGVIEQAIHSKSGQKFKALMQGDYSGYKSQSEADLALCSMLAFWCGGDVSCMDAVYRKSGLMRPKWDRKQCGSTYGALTLEKAVRSCQEMYRKKTSNYSIRIGNTTITPQTQSVHPETFDDMGNAKRLVTAAGGNLRYNYTDNLWLLWDGCKWSADHTGGIYRLCDLAIASMERELPLYENDEKMQEAFQKHMKKSRSFNSKKAMEQETRHLVPVTAMELDRHHNILNTPGGIVDLRTGAIAPCTPEQNLTMSTKCTPSDHADCPRWKAFLQEIFCGDEDLVRFIQKAVGYSLTGSTAEQCVFFLLGSGSNGKSTFVELLRYLFDSYATNVQAESIMMRGKSSGSASSDIARLAGTRFVTSAEPSEGMRINEGLLKQLSGEDVVTARKLYGNEFDFTPHFKLWMSTNHKPIIRGTDNGIWRRIRIIPFDACFDNAKKDRSLKYKLVKEAPQILRWAIDGCLLWQKEGLHMPRAVQLATDAYRSEMDVVSSFLDACCETGKGETKSSKLYAVYCTWAQTNNEYCMSNTKFSMEIAKRFKKVKKPAGIFYMGLSIYQEPY